MRKSILFFMLTTAVSLYGYGQQTNAGGTEQFLADEILLRDFEQIPSSEKVKNISQAEGVRGQAARFNGYTSEWEEPGLNISSKTLFIQVWIAPQQYSFNYDAIVHQADGEWKGFSLGVNYQGKLAGTVYADGKPQVCYSREEIPLLKWSHIAMSYREGEGTELFLNGQKVGKLPFAGKAVFDVKKPLIVGHCPIRQLAVHTGPKNEENRSVMHFHGLADELKITETIPDTAVLQWQIAATGKTGKQVLNFPDLPGKEIKQGDFGAFYTRLKYDDDAWESLWRVGDDPDIVVRFPDTPVKFVFWRGTGYVPAIVSENNIWVTDQCLEIIGLGECYEALSDKQCRYSHVRIIENTPARCVVHWRYAVSNVGNKIALEDEHGWGEWADEYWTVYPDGIAVRKQILHSPHCRPGYVPYEFEEILPLNAAGTRNEDNLELEAVTFADMDGNTASYSWENEPPQNFAKTKYQPVEMINIKAKYKPFFIFDPRRVTTPWYSKALEGQSNFAWWSHWPLAQLKSHSIDAVRPDKVSCTAIDCSPHEKNGSRLLNVEFGANGTVLYRSLIGATSQGIKTLLPLTRSWNNAPKLDLQSEGYENNGYNAYDRSYRITKKSADSNPLRFTIQATELSPVCNAAIVIDNIDRKNVAVRLNGKKLAHGKDFETGFIQNLDNGKLILWLNINSDKPVTVDVEN